MPKESIEKSLEIQAGCVRVWDALTDHRQFGEWFGVKLEAPFAAGKPTSGHITYPGYEHLIMAVTVTVMEAPRRFAFTWHPYAIDPKIDYSQETPTTVEFTLTPVGSATRVVVTETGFEKLPAHRRADALRMNTSGWEEQMQNLADHVAAH